jgi:hypothetical protein
MTGQEIACLSIGAIALGAVALGLGRSARLKAGRQRFEGFSVFDLQLTFGRGKGAEPPKTEASVYFTLKTSPREPSTAAKLLFDEKVRRLGE